MNDHRISRRSFLAAAGMAGAAAWCRTMPIIRCSRCPHRLRRCCFQRSIVRGFLCRRFLGSSPERGADRVCRRLSHRDVERYR